MSKRNRWLNWRVLTIATVVFFIAAGIGFLVVTVGESKRIEQSVIDRYGWTNEYTPPADGFVAPERMESFIRVRQAVQPNCAVFHRILDDIMELEAIEEDGEMPTGEKASRGLQSIKSMFNAAPNYLEFMDARNTALLDQEMGLGEYFYIYLAAYGEQLAGESESRYADMGEAGISPRTKGEIVLILQNQLVALESSGHETSGEELAAVLEAEIEALESGLHSAPWPNGPPDRTGESLAPFREHLDELYCTGIARTELMQKNRGLNFGG